MWADAGLVSGPQQVPEHPAQTDSYQQQYEHLWLLVLQAVGIESLSSHQSHSQEEHIQTQQAGDQMSFAGNPNHNWVHLLVLVVWFMAGGITEFDRGGIQICGYSIWIHSVLPFLTPSEDILQFL